MCRVPDWQERLRVVFLEWEHRPFKWGETDCACFASACVQAITGRDPLATYRGEYSCRLTALARFSLRGHRNLADAITAALEPVGGQPIDPRFAMVGDVGLTADKVICVRMPRGFVARAEGGYAAAAVEQAWAVAWE